MRAFLVTLLVAAVLQIAGAPAASACSCVATPEPVSQERADVVFEGDIVGYRAPAPMRSSADPAVWTFAVRKVLKGRVAGNVRVVSAVSGASCGLELPHAGRAVVYAHRKPYSIEPSVDGVELHAGLCDGTRLLQAAPATTTSEAAAPATPERGDGGGRLVPVLGGGAIALGLAAAGAVRQRRRSRGVSRP